MLSNLGQREPAHDAITEALGIIKPLFLKLPQAFAQWASIMSRNYLRLCEAADVEPDEELLGPIVEALQKMQRDSADDGESSGGDTGEDG